MSKLTRQLGHIVQSKNQNKYRKERKWTAEILNDVGNKNGIHVYRMLTSVHNYNIVTVWSVLHSVVHRFWYL